MALRLGGFLVVLCIFTTASSNYVDDDSNVAHTICDQIAMTARVNPNNRLYDSPQTEKLTFELRNPCKTTEYAVSEMNKLRASPDFNDKLQTVVIVTGGISHTDKIDTQRLVKAFNCRGDVNVIVVNTSDILDVLYYLAAYQTEILGEFVANGLRNLNIPAKNIHLIGRGLGAHLMGSAGRHFALQTGEKIARITGLDPARPCFKTPLVFNRLSVDDATFVDIIHSNPGEIGMEEPIGHADFYPSGLEPIPPFCMRNDIFCAHAMSMDYFEESVYKGNENNFMGSQCDAFANLSNGACTGTKAPMGYAANEKSNGIYFLEINGSTTFGENDSNSCGACTKK